MEPENFVEKLKETNAEILGLSTLLTTTRWEMKTIINELNRALGPIPRFKLRILSENDRYIEFLTETGTIARRFRKTDKMLESLILKSQLQLITI